MQAIARRAAAPIFALTLFSSAALIFVLQPLVGRMVTPLLGGSPAVWNISMAFFQGALLAGYLYAHLLARLRDLRAQALIHALVLLGAWFALPVSVSHALGPPSSDHPALWLVGVLALSVGAPFAAAAATAPLLQAWYARSGRADARDPYYLYAASNLGSFIGLLAYPALIEPLLGAQAQSLAWSTGYVVAAALIALAAATAIAATGGSASAPIAAIARSEPPSWRRRGYWLAAAAVPSALVLGVTLHISTDVAAAPLLWVVPLALYLVTFVIAFARKSDNIDAASWLLHPVALVLLVVSYFSAGNWAASLAGVLSGFFFSALVCHLALSRARPGADRLTEFYLFVSLGGVLGGAFAAFLAPVIFNNVYEYPLALAAACLFRPRQAASMPRLADCAVAGALAMAGLALALMRLAPHEAVLAAGAIGAAAAVMAAGWGAEADRPAAMRYAFLGIAALNAAVIMAVVFNIDGVFQTITVDDATHTIVRQPWGPAIAVCAFLTLSFVVQGALLPRRSDSLVADAALGVAIPTLMLLIALVTAGERLDQHALSVTGLGFCAIAIFLNRTRPVLLGALVLVAFFIIFLDDGRGGRIITQERSFFGVLRTKVLDYPSPEGEGRIEMRFLTHGTTTHGAQLRGPGVSRTPLTYYHPRTALGEAVLAGLSTGDTSNLALIGLGAGSTACLMSAGDRLTIFEIDPAVVRLSTTPEGDFTFVPECQPDARIELGDARLRIAEEANGAFDVILVDAFSSDAIPAHLLTREAIALYLSKTSDRGVVVLHLSNRNLALASEAARVAHALGVASLFRVSDPVYEPGNPVAVGFAASVMVLARSPEALLRLPLPATSNWRVLAAPPGRPWTDDYINLPRALWETISGVEECRVYPYVERCTPGPSRPAGG